MNDDILALVLVAFFISLVYIGYRVVKKNRQATAEYESRQAKAYEKLAEMNRETTRKLMAQDTARVAQRRALTSGVPSSTSTVASTPTPVNNWSNDLLTTMIISDMLSNHKDVSAGTVSWKDDTPTYKETYSKPSFGMDDDDSRKSASSSFSSSDSSSSWSDSSSSSSDSGPSSDW